MTDSHFNLLKTASYIVLLLAVVLFLSTKGITDESVISLNGDMPKYLMNGAYIHDLIDDIMHTCILQDTLPCHWGITRCFSGLPRRLSTRSLEFRYFLRD
jgi:hypothetical protein